MNRIQYDTHKEILISLTKDVYALLKKIDSHISEEYKENSENGRMEFAYVKYYSAELQDLLNLTVYLLQHDIARKYTYFPTRLIMEIVLHQENIYSVIKKEGSTEIKKMLFKDLAMSAKKSLEQPGEEGRDVLQKQLLNLDIASRLLKLDFKSEDVTTKSKNIIKQLCENSNLTIKGSSGSSLYDYYALFSETSHANMVALGAHSIGSSDAVALADLEISLEFTMQFCEMVARECNYLDVKLDTENLKLVVYPKFVFQD
ncbi:MAG: hypothetical protein UZ19_OD1000842 [Parcubacteria bacterium OLB19]|nr:MAG: hypothetical protein UZ19_OD1000842 [Parcubacteria bacterium OLB19]